MPTLNSVFSVYDTMITKLPVSYQAIISFCVLLFFIWMVYIFIKSKSWIFLAVIIVLLPETWPAAKNIGQIAWAAILAMPLGRTVRSEPEEVVAVRREGRRAVR